MQCEKCGKKVYANENCSCGQKAPKKNNGWVRVNTVICFIVLMTAVFSLILTLSLRTAVNRNMITESVREANLADISTADGKKLDKYLYDKYSVDPEKTVDDVTALLEENFIKDFIIEKVEAYQDYFLDKGDMPYITSDEILGFIDDNEDIIYEKGGLRFLETDREELRGNMYDADNLKDDSDDFFNSKFGAALSQTYFSYANAVFLIVLMAVIFIQWFIVYKANARRASKMIYKYGTAVILSSLPLLIAAAAVKFADDLDAADKLFGSAVVPFILYSSVMLAIGILMTVLGIIANNSYKNSGLKKAAVNIGETVSAPEYEQITEPVRENVCPNCSFANKDTASFCSRCGTKLK